jgi:hypothetical protein
LEPGDHIENPILDALIAEDPFTISIDVRRDPEDSPPGKSEWFYASASIRFGDGEAYPLGEGRTPDPAGAYAAVATGIATWLTGECYRALSLQPSDESVEPDGE